MVDDLPRWLQCLITAVVLLVPVGLGIIALAAYLKASGGVWPSLF